jgi:hypothetical protein
MAQQIGCVNVQNEGKRPVVTSNNRKAGFRPPQKSEGGFCRSNQYTGINDSHEKQPIWHIILDPPIIEDSPPKKNIPKWWSGS